MNNRAADTGTRRKKVNNLGWIYTLNIRLYIPVPGYTPIISSQMMMF